MVLRILEVFLRHNPIETVAHFLNICQWLNMKHTVWRRLVIYMYTHGDQSESHLKREGKYSWVSVKEVKGPSVAN